MMDFMNNYKLEYLVNEAENGNADAAYKAAQWIAVNGDEKEFIVQKHFLRAADLGNTSAQRYLGILGICNHLIVKGSNSINVKYNTNKADGFNWLQESACSGDAISTYLVGCCYKHGIGVKQDVERSAEYFKQVIDKISYSVILEAMLLFEFIINTNNNDPDPMGAALGYVSGITAIAS